MEAAFKWVHTSPTPHSLVPILHEASGSGLSASMVPTVGDPGSTTVFLCQLTSSTSHFLHLCVLVTMHAR